ncbi:hypothetical protein ACFFIS_08160 [Virgibacillus soli]|uniref:Uncharacterized protein n=1 Tax=Paracerasibacillus soli TaxID=480284 RepID=A0ABU5CXB2_9BACI|nr:hypothetical protein [Virgibacillus soli]MDY0410080.1 hypothetical protein [Virgibacillus soli]
MNELTVIFVIFEGLLSDIYLQDEDKQKFIFRISRLDNEGKRLDMASFSIDTGDMNSLVIF